MLSADDARYKAKMSKRDVVSRKISEAIANGRTSTTVYAYLVKDDHAYLIALGYRVDECKNETLYKISWDE